MKKINTFLTVLSLIVLIILNVSCVPSESMVQTAIAQTQSVYTPTPVSTPTPTAIPTQEPMPTLKPTYTPSYHTIDVWSGVTKTSRIYTVNNFCEFLVFDIRFSKKILPPNTSGYYTYYEAKSGSTFLDVIMIITNQDTMIKSAEDFASVTAIYDKKYNYFGSAILEDNKGGFTLGFYGIEPLSTGTVHYLIQVPEEVQFSKSLEIVIKVSDQEYHYKYR